MKVLVACEFSGTVSQAFRSCGHEAWSCDLLDTEGDSRFHIKWDVDPVLGLGWDMLIAHPPCTYLCNSGVRWLKDNPERVKSMEHATGFFYSLLQANIPKICVENPIPHKYARLPEYTQIIQPWQFGDNQTKATCLWLKNLPKLSPTVTVKPDNIAATVHRMAPGPDRQKNRSRFFPKVATAMADQWGPS